jgi:uncharacterized protein involved in type VI secretion and phage assembly
LPTSGPVGGPNAPRLERYDPAGAYLYATTTQAERAVLILQQTVEAHRKCWNGRGGVRSFTPGTPFTRAQHCLP